MLHSLLRNYLKLFGEDSYVLIHFITFTNCFKIVDEKLPKYSKPRSFRGPLLGLCPGPAEDLKQSPDPSPTFFPPPPPNTKSWIHPCNCTFVIIDEKVTEWLFIKLWVFFK